MPEIKVLFTAAELTPMAKVGGLGDVIGALPKSLKKLGIDVRIVIPKYGVIDEKEYGLTKIAEKIKVPFAGKEELIDIWQANLPMSEVPVYFIDNLKYLGKGGVYVEADASSGGSAEELHRFTFFARSIFEIFEPVSFWPDVIHCHDWHVGIIPFLEKYLEEEKPKLNKVKTLLTIHNLAYQGNYNYQEVLESLGISETDARKHNLIPFDHENIRYLEQAIKDADLLNTVSPKYAKEILTREYGCGLEKHLKKRKKDISGILNGIDLESFNPEVDNQIYKKYSLENIEIKNENKKHLQEISNLEVNEKIPVLGLVGRLADQKGIDLLVEILPKLEKENLQLVILGTGDPKLEKELKESGEKYPNKISVTLAFDATLAQKIYAGSDMFLMPSRFEPCGLGQMISMRYGNIPIVRATGGLADTVPEYNPETKEGTGFSFEKFTGKDFLAAIERALKMYHNKGEWMNIIKNGMSGDYSWDKSSQEYIKLYQKLLNS